MRPTDIQSRLIGALLIVVCCLPAYGSTPGANKVIVERFVDAGNRRDYDVIAKLVASDFVRHCQATPDLDIRSRDDFINFMKQDATVFPDSRVTLQQILAENDLVAVWAIYEGTQEGAMGPFPATGKKMQIDFGAIFRIEKNEIAELWVTWDNLAGLIQLGHIPPPAAESE